MTNVTGRIEITLLHSKTQHHWQLENTHVVKTVSLQHIKARKSDEDLNVPSHHYHIKYLTYKAPSAHQTYP